MTAWVEDEDLEEVLLQRYCSESASAEEADRIEAWFREHPDQRDWYEQLKAVLRKQDLPTMSAAERRAALSDFIREALERRPGGKSKRVDAPRWDGDTVGSGDRTTAKGRLGQSTLGAQARRLRRGEGGGSGRTLQRGAFKGQPLRGEVWYILAALVLTVLGIAVGRTGRGQHPLLAVSTYSTTNGQRANITLLDGTTVALNVASRLDVPADFAAGNHTVSLSGEALFTVSHHEGMPFTVVAGATTARVLGTTFSVRHYATDTVATVAVSDGKVAVGRTVLTTQQLVEVGPRGVSRAQTASASAFSFATGTLSLPYMPLQAAIPALDRWYDAEVRVSDPALATRRIGGEFVTGSLAELDNLLQMTLDMRVVREGRILTLYPRTPK